MFNCLSLKHQIQFFEMIIKKNLLLSSKNLKWIRDDIVLEILFLSLLIVPFLNIIDVVWLFTDKNLNEWNTIHTPIFIKILKDILMITLLAVLFWRKKTHFLWRSASILMLLVVFVFAITRGMIQKTPSLVILSGVRWYLPIFLFPLFDQFLITRDALTKLYRRYQLVILAALALQILQMFFSNRWNTIDGITQRRANGFFSQPQPMSLFALFFLIILFEIAPERRKKLNYFVTFISIALTKSATGILGFASLFFIKMDKKYRIAVGTLTLIIVAIFPYITGRLDFWVSPLTRLGILGDINLSHIVFGSYTNTCIDVQKIKPIMAACLIPDSFLTSVIGNLGLILGLVIIGVIAQSIYRSKKYYLFPILILFFLAANLTEYFPLNILFPFIVGFKFKTEETVVNNV